MNPLNPARFPDESFEDYKIRRNRNKVMIKKMRKGTLIFDSHKILISEGPNTSKITKGHTYEA